MHRSLRGWCREHRVELILFLLLSTTYAYFYQSTHHNEAARFDQLRAILHDRTLYIDKYWWNTADVIHYQKKGVEHIYPNKAPGMTLLALVPFTILSGVLNVLRAIGLPDWTLWHALTYLTTILGVSLPSAFAAAVMYRVLVHLTTDKYVSAMSVAAIWLGTLSFPYSTLFFSHQLVASLLAIAFYLLFRLGRRQITATRSRLLSAGAAGLLMSFSVAAEYPSALLVGTLCVYAVWAITCAEQSGRTRALLLLAGVAGLAVGGLALVAYNVVAFDRPFYVPYESYAKEGSDFSATYARGWLGLHLIEPKQFLQALASITVYPQIGMLYCGIAPWAIYACSPVLWLTLPGFVLMLCSRRCRAEGLLVAAMTLAYVLFITSYGRSIYDWSGASYLGSRHLIPLLPFLALPLAFGARLLRLPFYPLLAISVFYMLISTATEPRVAIPRENTARDLLIPDYVRARFAQNTDALFDGQRDLVKGSAAFNIGKLARLPAPYQLTPLLLWWLAAGGALLVFVGNAEKRASAEMGHVIRAYLRKVTSARLRLVTLFIFIMAVSFPPVVHYAAASHRGKHGLLGRYYDNPNWNGGAVETSVDAEINFDWSKSLPLPPPFSVEWSGRILIEQTDNYRFSLVADDGALLEIDGRVIVDVTKGPVLQQKSGDINLSPGAHTIRVRYFNAMFGGVIKLSWSSSARPVEIVPSDVLLPASSPP